MDGEEGTTAHTRFATTAGEGDDSDDSETRAKATQETTERDNSARSIHGGRGLQLAGPLVGNPAL